MIDIHTHLLPGVDDGSPSVEVSVGILEGFAAGGIRVVVCTPHLNASDAATAPFERHQEILEELRASAPPRPALELGWEIMLDRPGVDLRDRRLSLAGSSAVLVEFPRMTVPPNAAEEIFRLRMGGLVPVLAHPERYWGCTPERVEEWRRVGAVIQMDAAGLLGSGKMADLAADLLEEGLVDVLASDTHGDSRSLVTALAWLTDMGATEQAELLTGGNAGRLLAGEPTIRVPPLPRERGMIGRLREILFGRR
jgi:protein-tyrosine phosphatase